MLSGHFHVQNQESWSVMTYEFRSGFAGQIQEMLELRAAMGHSVKDYNSILANFDRFCMNHFPNETILTKKKVPVIFRLQYACGMRPQEVRCLRCLDFNFTDNTIYIADGKHHKDRCLPANAEVMEMCKRYNRIAEKMIPHRTYFFQAQSGKAYTTDWLCNAFRMCWEMSGNENSRGSCTPYALRHNFATQILMRWIEEGRDLDAMIPYLSAYMGHESFSATYYYIHLLPERLALMDFTRSDGIIPEVYDFEED